MFGVLSIAEHDFDNRYFLEKWLVYYYYSLIGGGFCNTVPVLRQFDLLYPEKKYVTVHTYDTTHCITMLSFFWNNNIKYNI